MKKCAWTRKRLVAYLNGELGRRVSYRIERHLEECADCLRECGIEKELQELLKSKTRAAESVSPPLPGWETMRISLERELSSGKGESRLSRIERELKTSLEEIALPKAARAFAEAAYWGKRATVPAAIVLLAALLYHSLEMPTFTPESASKTAQNRQPAVLRINFGPEKAKVPDKYYTDAGGACTSPSGGGKGKQFGWRKTNAG